MDNENTVEFVDWKAKAKEKLEAENKDFKGGREAEVVRTYVLRTLRAFCDESAKFAETVYKTKRTLSECCAFIVSERKQALSDLEAYCRAVQFYFPNADVEFKMNIRLTGEPPTKEEMEAPAKVKPEDKPKPVPKEQKAPAPEPVAEAVKKEPDPVPAEKEAEEPPKTEAPAEPEKKPKRERKAKKPVADEPDNFMQLSLWG